MNHRLTHTNIHHKTPEVKTSAPFLSKVLGAQPFVYKYIRVKGAIFKQIKTLFDTSYNAWNDKTLFVYNMTNIYTRTVRRMFGGGKLMNLIFN